MWTLPAGPLWVLLGVGLVDVEAGAHGVSYYLFSRRFEGDQHADGRLLADRHAAQAPHIFDAGLAAFDLDDDLLGLGRARLVAEKDFAIDAVVGPFLLLHGPRADEAQRRPSELTVVPPPIDR